MYVIKATPTIVADSPQIFNTWFKVKGSKVKVTAYVTANIVSRKYVWFFYLFILPENVNIVSGSRHKNVGHAVTC